VARKSFVVRFALIATFVALVLAVVPAAQAGKGKPPAGGSDSSLSLIVLSSPDGLAHYGGQVTFAVSTSATDRPYVQLDCNQGGALVYSSSAGFYAGYPWPWNQNFILSSSYWTGGGAACTATLEYWNGRKWSALKSISFPAYA
jgi:hypothetical protein